MITDQVFKGSINPVRLSKCLNNKGLEGHRRPLRALKAFKDLIPIRVLISPSGPQGLQGRPLKGQALKGRIDALEGVTRPLRDL